MPDLNIRNLPHAVHQSLIRSAALQGLSAEDVARSVLEERFRAEIGGGRQRAWLEAIGSIQDALRAAHDGKLPKGVLDEFLAGKRASATSEMTEVESYLRDPSISNGS